MFCHIPKGSELMIYGLSFWPKLEQPGQGPLVLYYRRDATGTTKYFFVWQLLKVLVVILPLSCLLKFLRETSSKFQSSPFHKIRKALKYHCAEHKINHLKCERNINIFLFVFSFKNYPNRFRAIKQYSGLDFSLRPSAAYEKILFFFHAWMQPTGSKGEKKKKNLMGF